MELIRILAVCFLGVAGISGLSVPVGDTAEFTTKKNCSHTEIFTLIRRLKDDSAWPVARRVDGVFQPEKTYGDRVEGGSTPLRVLLHRVNINDRGLYEFTCGGRVLTMVQLEVLVPSRVFMSAGETLKLPCHFFTLGESVESVRWEKDGESVLKVDASSGKVTRGTGFRDRASLSPDWKSLGDLSLELNDTRSEDKGDYYCFVSYKDADSPRQGPAVVRVSESLRPGCQTTCPPPQNGTAENGGVGHTTVVIIAIVTLVAGAGIGFGLCWYLKPCLSNTPCQRCCRRRGTEEDDSLGSVSSTGDQAHNAFLTNKGG